MSLFYVTHQGAQQGPYSKEQISDLLKYNKLNWNDYLFDEKVYDWIHIMEHALFTEEFNASFSEPLKKTPVRGAEIKDELQKRQWFILKENTNYGPFSKLELIQMLQGKTLLEHDFAWREGVENWKKISVIPEFSTESIREVHALAGIMFEKDLNKIFFKRKFVRAKLETRIIIHDEKKIYNSMSVEIGEGGAAFNLESAIFPIGQQLYLHFSAGEGLPQFNVISKVVSQRGTLFGVQFVNISGVAKSFIAKYAEDFKKAA